MRRKLLWLVMVLLLAGCTSGYEPGSYGSRRVGSPVEYARAAIPGWVRAEQEGLVVPLDGAFDIPGTGARIKLEAVWYSPLHTYLLYTTAGDRPFMATFIRTGWGTGMGDWGPNPYHHGYGAFSGEGFHQVMLLPPVERPLSADTLAVEVEKWYAMTPDKRDLAEPGTHVGPVAFELPVREEYLDPAPEQFALDREGTWLGRTLRVDRLEVSVGQARLHGSIALLPGEHEPGLGAELVFGDSVREMVGYVRGPNGSFVATFEPPDGWPAPVSLKLYGIQFKTEEVLEAVIPWGQFGGQEAVVKPADLLVMPFYDGAYRLHRVDPRGVSFEIMRPDRLPRVTPANAIPAAEFIGPDGETVTDMQRGGGHIGEGKDGVSYQFADEASPAMRAADEITVRFIHPPALLEFAETWSLVAP
ncbi:hypothetical protein J2Z79_002446 [Symbiobacterium terraclitae]|uniref:Uncharacterized protein n=1 Tax=Symbiobacterium terraclitae TaxID=557451 RepID=A0ABS4JU37_9FIRM|nr:hypothetical protein [Symbiobacterium terraclitae]MBP2019030.1 hypothetical protein [Symbiobacterium terraclitae]